MDDIDLWGYSIPAEWLTAAEIEYLQGLPRTIPALEWIWNEMDSVWDRCGLDNCRILSTQPVGEFYSHPVWLMNGIYTSSDSVSAKHRLAIALYLAQAGVRTSIDYGGGFGALARAIVQAAPDSTVYVVEPYISKVGFEQIQLESRIRLVPTLEGCEADAIIAQDVLEHVEDPVLLAYNIAKALRDDGKVIFANCFYPVIKCHLPANFHLRHTFRLVICALGLRYLGVVVGAEHAQVFERSGQLSLSRARRVESVSRLVGPVLNSIRVCASNLKKVLMTRVCGHLFS